MNVSYILHLQQELRITPQTSIGEDIKRVLSFIRIMVVDIYPNGVHGVGPQTFPHTTLPCEVLKEAELLEEAKKLVAGRIRAYIPAVTRRST